MLIQIKNRIILLEAVSYASIEFPNEDSTNDWIELLLIVDGISIVLTGEEALRVWEIVSRNAASLEFPEQDLQGGNALTASFGDLTGWGA